MDRGRGQATMDESHVQGESPPAALPTGTDSAAAPEPALVPAYQEWLTRLTMTYDAVLHCCQPRLDEPEQAHSVALAVILGLLAKPKVFQYFGLPYSGRIAHLAEEQLAEIRRGVKHQSRAPQTSWRELLDRLQRMPALEQRAFVLTCVEGYDGSRTATTLGCTEAEAQALLERALSRLEEARSLASGRERSVQDGDP